MTETAVFEFFVRKLPPSRGFLMAAGLEQAVEFLERPLRHEERRWLAEAAASRATSRLPGDFRFTGDSTPCPRARSAFRRAAAAGDGAAARGAAAGDPADQPAALPDRDRLARRRAWCWPRRARRWSTSACAGRTAPRPACWPRGRAIWPASPARRRRRPRRASACRVAGTMAHSFVQAHDDEAAAFEPSPGRGPTRCPAARHLRHRGRRPEGRCPGAPPGARGHRDPRRAPGQRRPGRRGAAGARDPRRGGLEEVRIFASGGIDETLLQRFRAEARRSTATASAPASRPRRTRRRSTAPTSCRNTPGRPKRKRSEGKATWPGRKQVYRRYDPDGVMAGDLLTVEGDRPSGEALIGRSCAAGAARGLPEPRAARAHAAARARSACRLP